MRVYVLLREKGETSQGSQLKNSNLSPPSKLAHARGVTFELLPVDALDRNVGCTIRFLFFFLCVHQIDRRLLIIRVRERSSILICALSKGCSIIVHVNAITKVIDRRRYIRECEVRALLVLLFTATGIVTQY